MGALDAPVRLMLRPSRLLAGVMTLVAAGAIAGILLAQIALSAKVLLASAVLADLRHRLRRHALLRGSAICGLTLTRDGRWRVRTADGDEANAELLPGSLVLPRLTVLTFRREGGGRAVVMLVPSNSDPDAFRRLRVRLRWRRQ